MLKAIFWVHLIVLFSVANLNAQISRDSFNYTPVGTDLNGNSGGGSFGMSGAWVGDSSFDIGAGSLTDPTGTIAVSGNRMTAASFNDNRDIVRPFTNAFGTDNTTTYFSFLIRPEGVLGQGAFGGWFGVALRGNVNDVLVGKPTGISLYTMERPGGANSVTTTKTVAVGESTLFVMRIDFLPGNDNIRLYVNPVPGAPEPSTSSAMTSAYDLGLLISANPTGPGAFSVDEIRSGSTFASVTTALIPGDFNLDGHLDANDISPMMSALADLNGYKKSNFTEDKQLTFLGDINGDHAVTNADLQALLDRLKSGGGSFSAVPEPNSILLFVGGILLLGLANYSRQSVIGSPFFLDKSQTVSRPIFAGTCSRPDGLAQLRDWPR